MKPKYLTVLAFVPFLVACAYLGVPTSSQPSVVEQVHDEQVVSKAGYCQARVTLEVSHSLNKLVVETYNDYMKDAPGFKPAESNDSATIPSVSFADPSRPALYYPQQGGKFHSTLCNRKKSPYFRCVDPNLVENLLVFEGRRASVSDYVRFYNSVLAGGKFEYAGPPREFGPHFIAIPLQPENLRDDNGRTISGLMHISIVKVYTSDDQRPATPGSKQLKKGFVKALEDRFEIFRQVVPSLDFRSVHCEKENH